MMYEILKGIYLLSAIPVFVATIALCGEGLFYGAGFLADCVGAFANRYLA